MLHRVLFAGCLFGLLAAAGRAADPAPGPDALARRGWTIAEVVLEKQVDPCTRQEMLLGGVRGLLHAADAEPPADLGRRVSAITTPEQFAALLKDVWPRVEGAKVKPDQLQSEFDAGLLAPVPGHAQLMPPKAARVTEQLAGNRYVGIGIQIGVDKKEHFVQIIDPFRRGTARMGGARPNDLIVEVDGRSTKDVPLGQVVEWLRGEEGSSVTIVVRQPGEEKARTLHLKREKVPIDTVFGYRRASDADWDYRVSPDEPVAYARVESVNAGTVHELRQLERKLRADGARALVLDLRRSGNIEGGLEPAGLMADALLDGGVLWRLRDAHGVREVRADAECLFRGWPLAVLVGDGRMSAGPEAVVAALQDNDRAVVVGSRPQVNILDKALENMPPGRAARVRQALEEDDGSLFAPTRAARGLPVAGLVTLPDGLGSLSLRTGLIERARKDRGWPVRPDHVLSVTPEQDMAVYEWLQRKSRSELPAGTKDTPPADPQLTKAVEVLRDGLKKAGAGEKTGVKGR